MYNVEVAAGLCGSKTKMGSKICRNVGVRPRFLIPEMGTDQLYFWEKINCIYGFCASMTHPPCASMLRLLFHLFPNKTVVSNYQTQRRLCQEQNLEFGPQSLLWR